MTTLGTATILRGDARALPLPDASVDLIVTSPPYFAQRAYTDGGEMYDGQIGAEATPREYIDSLIECTREWMRVLKPGGSMWVNLGDKYSGYEFRREQRPLAEDSISRTQLKAAPRTQRYTRNAPEAYGIPYKSLMALPARYEIRCIDDLGLLVRRDQIWSKTNGMPESCTDRTRTQHEYWFHLAKQPKYYANLATLREQPVRWDPPRKLGTRNKTPRHTMAADYAGWKDHMVSNNPLGKIPGSVWTISTDGLQVPDHVAHAGCCGGVKRDGCEDGLDHYAAFPIEWPRRLILGWSPSGICTACSEGRRLVVNGGPPRGDFNGNGGKDHRAGRTANSTERNRVYAERVAAGIAPVVTGEACACPDTFAPTRPSVVLDPFGGTGTTSLVAKALGRHGISVDMSADYCRLATWRTNDPGQIAKAQRKPKPPKPAVVEDGQIDLFAATAEEVTA